jgi:hypothetical protein
MTPHLCATAAASNPRVTARRTYANQIGRQLRLLDVRQRLPAIHDSRAQNQQSTSTKQNY